MMQEKIYIQVDPLKLRVAAFATGVLGGALLVMLDPWLRFQGLPARINWQETLLGAIALGIYGLLLAWLISDYWRSWWLGMGIVFTTPMVAGSVILWNNLMAVLGRASDYLLLLPAIFAVHGGIVLLLTALLHLGLRLPVRAWLPYVLVPLVLAGLVFGGLGAIRWSTQDAKTLMQQLDRYADARLGEESYALEYRGIRYQPGLAAQGSARIHSSSGTLDCSVRMYEADRMDITCNQEG